MARRVATRLLVLLLIIPGLLFASEPLRIVTWNLEWFPGGERDAGGRARKTHMENAQKALLELDPDVICLQEIRDWQVAEELFSVMPEIRIAVVSAFSGGQQQVIASKLASDSAWSAMWKAPGKGELMRGYAFACLEYRDGIFLLVYSLHLKANGVGTHASDIAKREEASSQLLRHVADMEKLYGSRGKAAVIVAGDFNTTLEPDLRFRNETTLRRLLESGFWWTGTNVPFSQRVTNEGSGRFAPADFDHILTKALGSPFCWVPHFKDVSDHQPVLIEINEADLNSDLLAR